MLQALGLAGNLLDYGNRDQCKINKRGRDYLRHMSLILRIKYNKFTVLYMRQNDVLYVEPCN